MWDVRRRDEICGVGVRVWGFEGKSLVTGVQGLGVGVEVEGVGCRVWDVQGVGCGVGLGLAWGKTSHENQKEGHTRS